MQLLRRVGDEWRSGILSACQNEPTASTTRTLFKVLRL